MRKHDFLRLVKESMSRDWVEKDKLLGDQKKVYEDGDRPVNTPVAKGASIGIHLFPKGIRLKLGGSGWGAWDA